MATGVPARFSSLDGMDRARERCAHVSHYHDRHAPVSVLFSITMSFLQSAHRVRDAWPMSSLHVQATVPLFTSRGWDLSELGSTPGTTVKLYTATAYLGLSQRAVVKLINTGEIAATCGRGNCWEVDITSLRAYKQKGYPRAS